MKHQLIKHLTNNGIKVENGKVPQSQTAAATVLAAEYLSLASDLTDLETLLAELRKRFPEEDVSIDRSAGAVLVVQERSNEGYNTTWEQLIYVRPRPNSNGFDVWTRGRGQYCSNQNRLGWDATYGKDPFSFERVLNFVGSGKS